MKFAAIALSIMLAGVVVFQTLLALGLPFGKAAWGGKHKVLPSKLRIASLISAVVLSFTIIAVLSKVEVISVVGLNFSTYYLWILEVYFAVGVVVNAISRSMVEKLWASYIAIMFVLNLSLLI
jgi:hypothetical protein